MNAGEYRRAVESLPFGKRLPGAIYLLDALSIGFLADDPFPPILRKVCNELRSRLQIRPEFNLLKFHLDSPKISFLSYPEFFKDPHPELKASVVVDLVTGKVRRDDYSGRANPPLLHRKETFLPPDHPNFARFQKLTRSEEEAGLLDDGPRIGFRLNWERTLAEKGYRFRGHRLVKVEVAAQPAKPAIRIHRHRTAIVRTEPSKPVKLLLENKGMRQGDRFFDYGCGYGADVEAISQLGWAASGWDPVHAPEGEKRKAEVVNLGFVLNVIEDPAERVETLLDAWNHCGRLLVVSTLVQGQEGYAEVTLHHDGVLTRRGTFQKHFEQSELQGLIEHTLHVEAVPVALGIFFVFRETSDLQDFLAERSRRFIDWESLSRRLGLYKAFRARKDPYVTHRELLDSFWETMLSLGRLPRNGEFEQLSEVRSACGSMPKALALFREKFGEKTLEIARERRKEDVLVYVGAGLLRKRIPFTRLSAKLQQDIRSFFGNFSAAEEKARDLLFTAGDKDELMLAIESLDFGWWDPEEEHFTIHRSLLNELPAILRVYVECGSRLFGNPREADLIKIHVGSRKLTMQTYDDFDCKPLPVLKQRIKIDLRRLFVTVFDHTSGPSHQVLYFKERFLPAAYPERKKMEQFSNRLRKLGFEERTIGYGPPLEEFQVLLDRHGLTMGLNPKKEGRRTS